MYILFYSLPLIHKIRNHKELLPPYIIHLWLIMYHIMPKSTTYSIMLVFLILVPTFESFTRNEMFYGIK